MPLQDSLVSLQGYRRKYGDRIGERQWRLYQRSLRSSLATSVLSSSCRVLSSRGRALVSKKETNIDRNKEIQK